jgi:hypothetical protein
VIQNQNQKKNLQQTIRKQICNLSFIICYCGSIGSRWSGVTAAHAATIRAANATLPQTQLNDEAIKQSSVQSAKDTLRNTGDTAPC